MIGNALFLASLNRVDPGDVTREIFNKNGPSVSLIPSLRLQLRQAAKACEILDLDQYALSLRAEKPHQLQMVGRPDVCIVGKLADIQELNYSVQMANMAAISKIKANNIPLISTYSDNWCNALKTWKLDPEDHALKEVIQSIQNFYRELLYISDVVVAPANGIALEARKWVNPRSKVIIIEDPIQVNRYDYQIFDHKSACRIIWFGHPANVSFLLNVIPDILINCKASNSFELTILGNEQTCKKVSDIFKLYKPKRIWNLRLIYWQIEQWSPVQLEAELARAHIAILPSDLNNERKVYASHNRAIDAIQAGCMVIATPIPSYRELAKCCLLGDNFSDLIDAGIADYERLIIKWENSRDLLLKPFTSSKNIEKWIEIIQYILK